MQIPATPPFEESVRPVRPPVVWQAIKDGHAPPGGFANPQDRAAWTAATFGVTKFG